MVSGHPPFAKALPNNPHYNIICVNNSEKFWNIHSKSKENGTDFFGFDFMDFINRIFCFDSTQRSSIAEIACHPWMKGDTATSEEVYNEFINRKEMVEQAKEIAKQEQLQKKEKNINFKAVQPTRKATYKGPEDQTEQEKFDNFWEDLENEFYSGAVEEN